MSLVRSGLALLALTSACAGTLSNGVYRQGDVRYRIGAIPAGWQAVGLEGNDLAFQSLDSPHSVAVNATCEDHDDPPLDVLTRHLLMGFTERETVSQRVEALDGRDALRTRVTAKLDGVPVELILVVLKKNGCVYDFTYLSPVGRGAERVAVFDQLLAQFAAGKTT
ncbi:MAG: hypothetical protein ACO1OB_24790 [Archangium sp.]